MRFTTCSGCSRHVRIGAGVCPFCDAAISPPGRTAARVGAVLVGAAAISTLGGCPRPAAEYGGPPVPPPEERAEPVESDVVETEPSQLQPPEPESRTRP